MRYLSCEDVLVIHARIIDKTGGMHGVRDINLLASVVERPKMQFGGKDLYPTVFDKAAVYFESCARHHAFVDGNKRTAAAIVVRFLYLNDYMFIATNKAVEKFVLDAVVEKFSLKSIASWFKKHSKKTHGNYRNKKSG